MTHTGRSRGAVLFARVGSTQLQIATKLGVSNAIVAFWQSGKRLPKLTSRKLLLATYKIPIESWDEAPESPITPPSSKQTPNAWGENAIASRITNIERRIDELFFRLDNDGSVTLLEYAKVTEILTRNLRQLRDLRGEGAPELKVMKHAKLVAVRDEILAIARDYPTPKGYPPILRLIVERLEEAEDEEKRAAG